MSTSKTFYLNNGKTFSNVKALAKELKTMSKEVYNHHVNPTKNDFANWVKNSIKDEVLTKKIDGHINKIEMELEILRHLIHKDIKKKKKVSVKTKIVEIKPKLKKKKVKASNKK